MFFSLKKSVVAIFIAVTMFSAPAFADATGIGTGIGQAAATVNGGKTYNLAGGGVGAANCANAVGLGPISASSMADICKREISANYFAKRGDFALADQIMMGDPLVQKAIKQIAAAKKAKSVATAGTTSTKSPVKGLSLVRLTVGGVPLVLQGATLDKYNSCVPLKAGANGPVFKKAGC